LVSSSELGNSAFCTLETYQFKAGTLLLEVIFTMHCVSARHLQPTRFLPQSYLRLVVDENGNQYQADFSEAPFNKLAGRIPRATAQELVRHARPQISRLLDVAQAASSSQQASWIQNAVQNMTEQMHEEIQRLSALAEKNPNIRQQEIDHLIEKQQQLHQVLQSARLTLDALRVAIVTEPS
jgi:ATP-dependent helicase HepA